MSSVTVRNISANSLFMFATGLAAAAVQILFLREYLSVFSGNELVIGIILALWLLAAAGGSYAGSRIEFQNQRLLAFLYVCSVILGLLVLRAAAGFLFMPGAMIPPWAIVLIVLLTQSDAAFFGGFTFGRLTRQGGGRQLYLLENAGAAVGLLFVSSCILFHVSNGTIAVGALVSFSVLIALSFIPFNKPVFGNETAAPSCEADIGESRGPQGAQQEWGSRLRHERQSLLFLAGSLLLIAGFITLNPVSVRWKYPQKVDKVVNGYGGEIALGRGGTVFLNNVLYRAGMPLPSVEQAVHVPAALHAGPLRRALVIGTTGHMEQLRKYAGTDNGKHTGISIECLETEPLLADSGCTCGAVENIKEDAGHPFDLILLGSGMPSNGAASRFYTLAFFRKMRTLAGNAGVFSFSLPLSGNFLSPGEKRLNNLLHATLSRAFRHVLIIPGEGYTYVASDTLLSWPVTPLVRTRYLEAYTLASLTPERMRSANALDNPQRINTVDKPAALLFAQQQWLGLFGFTYLFFLGALAVLCIAAMAVLPRTGAALSVGTSGFTAGVYSVALLLIYQYCHGTLYSAVSLLMIALTIGFVLGSRVKRFPFSDPAIGVYAAISLIILVTLPFPPLALFLLFHAGMGFLAAAQFATRTGTSWGGLYAADLAGGVFGMALCSTVLIPHFGITIAAIGLCLLKLLSAEGLYGRRGIQTINQQTSDY